MSIQFQCSHCQQPIEVDDEHAGRSAACPYCRSVITVPRESTYRPEAVVAARPAGDEAVSAGDPSYESTDGPLAYAAVPTTRDPSARKYATVALVCGVVVAALWVVSLIVVATILEDLAPPPADQPPPTMKELYRDLQDKPAVLWAGAAQCFQIVVALIGVIVGAISLTKQATGNWRAWVGVVVCGMSLLCMCGGTAMQLAGTATGAG